MSIEITFVRHGESEANVEERWQGHGDSRLSVQGWQQVMSLSKRFAGQRFDRIESSDLIRARETARGICRAVGQPLREKSEWREIDVGRWEGLTREEVVKKFPEEMAKIMAGEDVKVGGAESWGELAQRGLASVRRLQRELPDGGRALVVAHGGIIASTLGHLFSLPRKHPRPLGNIHNTAITTVRFEGDRVALDRYNDALHAGPLSKWAKARLEKGDCAIGLFHDHLPHGYTPGVGHYEFDSEDPADLEDALANLQAEHAGQRITMKVPARAIRRLSTELLTSEAVRQASGITHAIRGSSGTTFADLCVGSFATD